MVEFYCFFSLLSLRSKISAIWLMTPGVNLSLLSRVMSSRLSRGTYNGGLLSTEAGTIARVITDVTITLAGYLGQSRLLNATLLPSLLICIASIFATCRTYNSLYWCTLRWFACYTYRFFHTTYKEGKLRNWRAFCLCDFNRPPTRWECT